MSIKGRTVVLGGAGFVGRHLIRYLRTESLDAELFVIDKFVHRFPVISGSLFDELEVTVINSDIGNLESLTQIFCEVQPRTVIHLAANADISKASTDPSLDFFQGTLLTQNALEASRISGAKRFIFTSGSGVYGRNFERNFVEADGFGEAVSPYASSKISSETLIECYSNMFGFESTIFRMGNVVGPGQTHGVGMDFLQKLWRDPMKLRVLGNGNQRKPYIHVEDVVRGIFQLGVQTKTRKNIIDRYNLATADSTTVKEIAVMAVEIAGNDRTVIEYGESAEGWPGDVPIVSLDSTKAGLANWVPSISSNMSVYRALKEMAAQKASYGF